jgi:hypothetical protein
MKPRQEVKKTPDEIKTTQMARNLDNEFAVEVVGLGFDGPSTAQISNHQCWAQTEGWDS